MRSLNIAANRKSLAFSQSQSQDGLTLESLVLSEKGRQINDRLRYIFKIRLWNLPLLRTQTWFSAYLLPPVASAETFKLKLISITVAGASTVHQKSPSRDVLSVRVTLYCDNNASAVHILSIKKRKKNTQNRKLILESDSNFHESLTWHSFSAAAFALCEPLMKTTHAGKYWFTGL